MWYGHGVAVSTHIGINAMFTHAGTAAPRPYNILMPQLITIGTIIDKTLHLYQKHFGTYVQAGLWLLLSVPLVVLVSAIIPSVNTISGMIVIGGIMLVNTIGTLVVGYFVNNTFIFGTRAFAESTPDDLRALQKRAWLRVWPMLLLGIVLGLLLVAAIVLLAPGVALLVTSSFIDNPGVVLPALGMFLLFAGGLSAVMLVAWFSVIFPFAPFTLLLENRSVIAAVRRAFALVRGRWWATMLRVIIPKLTFGVVVLFGQLIVVLIFTIVSAGITPLAAVIGDTAVTVVISALQQTVIIVVAAVTTPVFVIADYYVFTNLVATRSATS